MMSVTWCMKGNFLDTEFFIPNLETYKHFLFATIDFFQYFESVVWFLSSTQAVNATREGDE